MQASYSPERHNASTEPPHSASIDLDGKIRVWSIGKRHIVAMIFGVVILAFLRSAHVLGFTISDSTDAWSVSFFPVFLTLLFFGDTFGPWVGLVTGGVGYLIGLTVQGIPVYWLVVLSYALTGFIAGLTRLNTQGRYNNARPIAITVAINAATLIIGRI